MHVPTSALPVRSRAGLTEVGCSLKHQDCMYRSTWKRKYSNVCCLSNAGISQDPSRPAFRKMCVQEKQEGPWKNPDGLCGRDGALGLPGFRKYPLGDTGRKKLCLRHMKERLEAGSGRLDTKIWTGQSRAIQNAKGGQWVTMALYLFAVCSPRNGI